MKGKGRGMWEAVSVSCSDITGSPFSAICLTHGRSLGNYQRSQPEERRERGIQVEKSERKRENGREREKTQKERESMTQLIDIYIRARGLMVQI